MVTPVIFRKFKKGDIIALFPNIPDDMQGWYILSYMHTGQHSGASYNGVVSSTKLASVEEYTPLLSELKRVGYDDLKVYKKQTAKHRKEIEEEIAKIKYS